MNFLLKFFSILILFFHSFFSTLNAFEISPYVGVTHQVCKTCFKPGHGSNLFRRNSFGINPFIGFTFNEYLSMELGYQNIKATRTVTLSRGDSGLGIPLPAMLSPATFETKFQIKGSHMDLIVNAPKYNTVPFQIFGGFGLSHTTVIFKRKCMQLSSLNRGNVRTFEKTRTLRRFILGVGMDLTDNISVRFSSIFINTGKLLSNPSDGIVSSVYTKVIPENSVCYAIGFKYSFN